MNVSIIIPTLLGHRGPLKACLDSLRLYAPKDTEIIVTGLGVKRSFAENCNDGARTATGHYLLFLNDDCVVKSGFLDPMVGVLDEHLEVGMVGSKLIYPDGSIQHAGIYFDQVGDQLHGFNCQDVGLPSRAVKGITGACALVRRDEYLALGGFDEGYVNGNEDCSLSLSYLDSGQTVWYEASSVVVHAESQSGPERWAHVGDNVRRFTEQWLHRPDLWKE